LQFAPFQYRVGHGIAASINIIHHPIIAQRAVQVSHIVEHSSDKETMFGSSRQLGEVAEHLIDGSEKRISRLSFEFYSLHVH